MYSRETVAAQRDTGVGVPDLEIIRIGPGFDARAVSPLLEAGAALKARAVPVAGDNPDFARLVDGYAQLCDVMLPFGLTADLEFMPWTKGAQTPNRDANCAGSRQPKQRWHPCRRTAFRPINTTLDDIRAISRALLHYAQICDATAGTHFDVEAMIHSTLRALVARRGQH